MTIFGTVLSPEAAVSTAIGVVFGGIVSAIISFLFARQSSRELKDETNELKARTDELKAGTDELKAYSERLRMGIRTLARALQVQGALEVKWDNNGDPENIVVTATAGVARVVTTATPPGVSVGDPPPAGP